MSVTLLDTVPADTPGAPDFSITNTAPTPPAPTPASAPTASNKKWLRAFDIFVAEPASASSGGPTFDVGSSAASKTQGNRGVSLADFRVVFSVDMATDRIPWRMTAKVYNVPDALAAKIVSQYTDVTMVAGYRFTPPNPGTSATTITYDAQGLPVGTSAPSSALPQGYKPGGSHLFSGQVVWYERGRENATDSFLTIYANCFDIAHSQTVVNTTLPAGYTQKDVVQACVDAMKKDDPNIKLGTLTAGMEDVKSPRARTLYDMPRNVLRDVAQSVGGFVYIDVFGGVNILKLGDTPATGPDTPLIKFNFLTGLVGVPSQNADGGMSARCLLNPAIQPFTRIQLNNTEVTKRTLSQSGVGVPTERQGVVTQQASIQHMLGSATDGIYTVWAVKHSGDTRGNPWYTDVITQSANPASQAPKFG